MSAGGDPDAKIELLVIGSPTADSAKNPSALPWKTAAAQPSSEGKPFAYTAASDGEYWFATRTVSAAGPMSAIGSVMKVFVDTTPPKIDLVADADGDGNVRIDMSVDDASETEQIQVRYTTRRRAKWIDVETPKSGGMVIKPEGDWDAVAVHVTATDAAGNRNAMQKIVSRPRIATQPMERYASAPVQQYDARLAPYRAGNDGPSYRTAAGREAFELPAPATREQISRGFEEADVSPPVPTGVQLNTGVQPNEMGLIGPDKTPQTRPPETRDQDSLSGGGTPLKPAEAPPRPSTPKEAMKPLSEPSAITQVPGIESKDREAENVEAIPAPSGALDSETGSTSRYRANRLSEASMSDGVPIRYSDSERFSLEYELEAVGGKGVDAIQLYGSLDEGKTWSLWGQDPDKVSPFDIETREEGVFGYRIVVEGQNGLASPRPLAGEAPDILVVVDKTKPEVRITAAKYGVGSEIGSLVIEYECEDPNLKDRPISLSFSTSPEGPWTTIAGGLTNKGRYAWPADPQLPRAFYLRIDATDSAGNVASHVLDQPIDAQGLAPRARIRGFRSM